MIDSKTYYKVVTHTVCHGQGDFRGEPEIVRCREGEPDYLYDGISMEEAVHAAMYLTRKARGENV